MKQPKVIKRYANRKLYDTERSCYVTLEEISQMIKDGEDVQVIDNRSKDDLTAVTLAQILVEEEKKVAKMPLKLLRGIIQSGNDALNDFYQKRVADPVTNLREDVERRVDGLFRKDDKSTDETVDESLNGVETQNGSPAAVETGLNGNGAESHANAESEDDKASPVREWVSATQGAFETFQKRIDDQVKQTLSRMGNITTMGTEVDSLRSRIAELEQRLVKMEEDERPLL